MQYSELYFDYQLTLKGNLNAKKCIILHDELTPLYDEVIKEHDILILSIQSKYWFRDFSPFKHPHVFKGGEDFEGKADEYLLFLKDNILPYVKGKYQIHPEEYYLAGYSLSGLFAIYAASKTDMFQGVISASGSLWFPSFISYLKDHEVFTNNIYLSIGDKESETKNPYLSKGLQSHFEALDIFNHQNKNVIFDLNHGGHFIDHDIRIIKGIDWMLDHISLKEEEA